MATRKQKAALDTKAETEEVKAAPPPVKAPPEVERAEAFLDRLRQQATAGRDRMAWQQYQGACEMARGLGYTVNLVGEKKHVLTKTL